MNLDPETLFALLDEEPLAPIVPTGSTPAVPTQDTGSDQTPSASIVGDHFFWASGSVPVDLSQSSQVLRWTSDARRISGSRCLPSRNPTRHS